VFGVARTALRDAVATEFCSPVPRPIDLEYEVGRTEPQTFVLLELCFRYELEDDVSPASNALRLLPCDFS
jgi:hypothetical protein